MAAPLQKRIKRYTVFALIRLIGLPFVVLPLGLSLRVGRTIARRLPWLVPGLFQRCCRQIEESLGTQPRETIEVARDCFENIGLVALEVFNVKRIRKNLPDYVTLRPSDVALLREALSEGKGVLFVSAHLSNWELLAQRVAAEGIECASLARRSPNPYLGRYLVRMRRDGGVETINRGDPGAARTMLGVLKRGGILGALVDQDTRVPSVFVPFLGRLAKTPSGAAELALKRRLPVILGFGFRRPEGGIALELSRLDCSSWSFASEESVQSCVHQISLAIENAVRRQPGSWVWFHERWKSRP